MGYERKKNNYAAATPSDAKIWRFWREDIEEFREQIPPKRRYSRLIKDLGCAMIAHSIFEVGKKIWRRISGLLGRRGDEVSHMRSYHVEQIVKVEITTTSTVR